MDSTTHGELPNEAAVAEPNELVGSIVRVASVMNILKHVGEDYSDLIPLIKYLISEVVVAMHTNSYLNGIAEELGDAIKLAIWDVADDELKLTSFLNDLVSLYHKVMDGVNDLAYARAVFKEFTELFNINVGNYPKISFILNKAEDPSLILQTILTGLVISVRGVGGVGDCLV